MTTPERFKIWLEVMYISDKTGRNLKSAKQYTRGIDVLNERFNLQGEGIYNPNADLKLIRNLIDKPENFHKDYSSHFNAFMKFREYDFERENKTKQPLQRQTNPFKKQRVEISAIETTIKHFEKLDYIVISKEKDNVGWDLEARNQNETLLLEVKGLSGKVVSIELTSNEYKNLTDKKAQYKICVVTSALSNPILEIFHFDREKECWINEQNQKLQAEERVSVRMWK